MKKRIVPFVGGIVAGLLSGVAGADIVPVPGLTKFYSQAQFDQHYKDGYDVGVGDGKNVCKGSPKDCGITLAATMTSARYGETEPNDDMVSANPLVPDTKYWGQSMSRADQDWFYISTYKPNEMVTINFTIPQRPTGQNVGGWIISVRDAAGNVLAQFHTAFMENDPATASVDESREIKYPVFLAHTGTQYIVVEPETCTTGTGTSGTGTGTGTGTSTNDPTQPGVPDGSTGSGVTSCPTMNIALYYPYNLAVHIEPSDIEAPPIDVNFTDVEVEPNDTAAQANALTSGKTVYGMLNTKIVGDYLNMWSLQSEQDWFWYQSPGDDTVILEWCRREDCPTETARQWRVTITDDKGAVMSTFHAGGPASSVKTIRIGLKKAGVYYMQVQGDIAYICDLNEPYGCPDDPDNRHDHQQIGLSVYQRCSDWSVPSTVPGGANTSVCLHWDPISQVTDEPYNFTWRGTKLLPTTYTR